tara:strand:+ start:101 stop:415 length:315 start_codon:yes stop_codon:yes gene_type:complete
MDISLSSYNFVVIEHFYKKILNKAIFTYGLSVEKKAFLPTVYKKIVVLKSPHVNAKSKERFSSKTHKCVLRFNTLNNSRTKLTKFQNYLNELAITNLSVKVSSL